MEKGITEEAKLDTRCETCAYLQEDPETGEEYCSVSMDQDELWSFLNDKRSSCPHYRYQDDYTLSKKQ